MYGYYKVLNNPDVDLVIVESLLQLKRTLGDDLQFIGNYAIISDASKFEKVDYLSLRQPLEFFKNQSSWMDLDELVDSIFVSLSMKVEGWRISLELANYLWREISANSFANWLNVTSIQYYGTEIRKKLGSLGITETTKDEDFCSFSGKAGGIECWDISVVEHFGFDSYREVEKIIYPLFGNRTYEVGELENRLSTWLMGSGRKEELLSCLKK